MSVQSEITRISNAESALKATLEARGVTVPSGTKLGGLPSLIGQVCKLTSPTAGDYPILENTTLTRIQGTTPTSTGASITVPVAGTYRFKWCAVRTSSSGTSQTQLYRTRSGTTTAIGEPNSTWSQSWLTGCTLDVACKAGDVIEVWANSGAASSYITAGKLTASVAQCFYFNSAI